MTTSITDQQDEMKEIVGWRLKMLFEAGYALPHAEKLAESCTGSEAVDLHEAVRIRKAVEKNPDCRKKMQAQERSKLAYRIVRPLP